MKNINQTNLSVCIPYKEKVLDAVGIRGIQIPSAANICDMEQQFKAAPQFQSVDLFNALTLEKGKMRVLLVGDDTYSMEQCAMYLTTISEGVNPSSRTANNEDFGCWDDLDDDDDDDDDEDSMECDNTIVAISSALFAPPPPSNPMEAAALAQMPKPKPDCVSLYVNVPKGDNVTAAVTSYMINTYEDHERPHLFLAITPDQLSKMHCDSLQLHEGFTVCKIGSPTTAYLEEVFWNCAEHYYTGIRHNENVSGETVVDYFKNLRGKEFSQRDIESCVQRTFKKQLTATTLDTNAFCFEPVSLFHHTKGKEKLAQMLELDQVQHTVDTLLGREFLNKIALKQGRTVEATHRHMAFSGAPGTGKTESARIIAKILQEEGSGSGLFVQAGREDVIGKFLGHTTDKVAKLFEKAQGGVLFIDEVGSLVPSGSTSDSYAEEAINVLVDHMEKNPETIVIFATYEDEMERFLSSNPGLHSRISHHLHFKSYKTSTLLKILENLANQNGYDLDEKAAKDCGVYLKKLEKTSPTTFGNAREVRRIFNAAQDQMALRLMKSNSETLKITVTDMKNAIKHMDVKQSDEKRLIGFAV